MQFLLRTDGNIEVLAVIISANSSPSGNHETHEMQFSGTYPLIETTPLQRFESHSN